MKRISVAVCVLVVCIVGFLVTNSWGKISNYMKSKESIEVMNETLSSMRYEISELDSELSQKRGDGVPKTLPQIMAYISEFSGVSINTVKAFDLNGSVVHYVKTVTNMSDSVVCDGFEIDLTVSDILGFVQYFDESEISYNSIDLLFGSETVILRLRTGGGV